MVFAKQNTWEALRRGPVIAFSMCGLQGTARNMCEGEYVLSWGIHVGVAMDVRDDCFV